MKSKKETIKCPAKCKSGRVLFAGCWMMCAICSGKGYGTRKEIENNIKIAKTDIRPIFADVYAL